MNTKELENGLINIGYRGLFMQGDNDPVDSIWENGRNIEQLENIGRSASMPSHARFLAIEVLRHFNVELDKQFYDVFAEAYAYALKSTSEDRGNVVQLNGNLWGLLYEEDDVGYLGKQFIEFGDAAIGPLTRLLDDNASRILYEGSEEAVIGSAYQYRIKDFAAFYLSKIKGIPIEFLRDFEQRDKEIGRLKVLLREG